MQYENNIITPHSKELMNHLIRVYHYTTKLERIFNVESIESNFIKDNVPVLFDLIYCEVKDVLEIKEIQSCQNWPNCGKQGLEILFEIKNDVDGIQRHQIENYMYKNSAHILYSKHEKKENKFSYKIAVRVNAKNVY